MDVLERNYHVHLIRSAFLITVFLFGPVTVFAQQADYVAAATDNPEAVVLSAEAVQRIESVVRAARAEKESLSPAAADAFGQNPFIQPLSSSPITYNRDYVDTVPGDNFSFPEDTHDFCRAAYDPNANQDYYLNAAVFQAGTYTATLDWTNGGDYDIYLFDSDGRQVGDPAGQFPTGNNGIAFQGAGDTLQEQASVEHAGDTTALIVVVDHFRGPTASTLTVTVDGVDGTYNVLEYQGNTGISYVDAAADAVLAELTEGAVIDTSLFSTNPRSYNFEFSIDDCAESAVFELTDSTGQVIASGPDSDLPFTLFGDTPLGDGTDYNGQSLPPGTYTITVTPFGNDNGEGASGEPVTVTFTIPGPAVQPPDPGTITGFTLINADADTEIPAHADMQDGEVIDLLTLESPDDLNILVKAAGDVDNVSCDLVYNDGGWQDVASAGVSPDSEAPYSVYGGTGDDFASALMPIGTYTLTCAAAIGGETGTPSTINFTVIGPRISSYTLIRVDNSLAGNPNPNGTNGTDLPVADFDPIPEGALIDLAAIDAANPAEGYNIRANTLDFDDPRIESVQFILSLDNTEYFRTRESARPYAVFGDFNSFFQDDPNADPPRTALTDIDPDTDTNYAPWVLNAEDNIPAPTTGSYNLIGNPGDVNSVAGRPFGSLEINFQLTSVPAANAAEIPSGLAPNFPNPFNPTTTIRFMIEDTSPVTLVVVDLLGREVRRLVDGTIQGGVHEVVFDAGSLASGMYFYRLETPDFKQVRLMTLLK